MAGSKIRPRLVRGVDGAAGDSSLIDVLIFETSRNSRVGMRSRLNKDLLFFLSSLLFLADSSSSENCSMLLAGFGKGLSGRTGIGIVSGMTHAWGLMKICPGAVFGMTHESVMMSACLSGVARMTCSLLASDAGGVFKTQLVLRNKEVACFNERGERIARMSCLDFNPRYVL